MRAKGLKWGEAMQPINAMRAIVALVAACGCFTQGVAAATLGGPVTLSDMGSFYVGGRNYVSDFADARADAGVKGTVRSSQMYVQFQIPQNSNGVPVIMVHGANHTGVTYETTPDGREGWGVYFSRKNHPVYIVDQAGRGRSGFDPSAINRARIDGAAKDLPAIAIATRENAWMSYRLGPSYGVFWPDSRFPQQSLDQYFSQSAAMAESTLPGAGENTIEGLKLLLEKVGPAVLLVHSQSGAYGLAVAKARPDLVRALVSIEGDCVPMDAKDVAGPFKRVSMLSVWGDHSFGFPSRNGDDRRNGCDASIKAIAAAGGNARFLLLPEEGIKGNSHMMMLENNNLQIADLVIAWIAKNAGQK